MANVRPTPSTDTAPPSYAPTQPTRRGTAQSVSSTRSTGSERSAGQSISHPAVESAVTRLLVAIKQLLEALTQWSSLQASEEEVSDVYVKLGNSFNEAVAAFAAFNIDMAELMSVPEDLRAVLEQCLAEEASQENLDLFLPTVRQIITNLLQGLRGKQSIYRRIMSEHRHKSSEQSSGGTSDREGRTRSSRREGERGHRHQSSRTASENEQTLQRDSVSRRSAMSSTSSRRKDPQATSPPTRPNGIGAPAKDKDKESLTSPTSRTERLPQTRRRPQSPGVEMSHAARPISPPIGPRPSPSTSSLSITQDPVAPFPISPSQVPASVKRYSLVDNPSPSRPSPPPAILAESSSTGNANTRPVNGNGSNGIMHIDAPSPPSTPPIDPIQAPAIATSLAALQRSETLERRASKRFSTYNISKMTGGSTTRERSGRGNHANRRSLAASNAPLTNMELAVLTEETEEPSENSSIHEAVKNRSRSVTPHAEAPAPPVPPLPTVVETSPEPVAPPAPSAVRPALKPSQSQTLAIPSPPEGPQAEEQNEPLSKGSRRSFPVFLQLGREVKKVTIEPGLSFSSLRVLFVDRFSYNPGLENFPAIYIRDPSSGVQYELEDMEEVKEKCLLSLNIEPLDQIKQHIDTQISVLSRDIKELRTTVAANRHSFHNPTLITSPLAESSPPPNRPTDRRFVDVARRISRLGLAGEGIPPPPPFGDPPLEIGMQSQPTGQSLQVQMTGGSVLSEYSTRVVTDLKTQFDEVQNLRRDLGIMRQLYSEFMKSTKDSLGVLRTQTLAVKQLANSGVGGARAYIDSGKRQLDVRSQNVLTKVEELQDTVEGIKDDVLKRHVTPKPALVKRVKQDIQTLAAELESLKEHMKTIQPMWKKTWAEELQNVVEEQQFLKHQEDFLNDLLEDHAAVVEVYGHVEKVISIRSTGPGRAALRTRGFKPPPPEEGHTGLGTVMLEIRGAAVDPEKRMKAIAANQKNREKELELRSNELQAELSDFVGGKKLKMTGGAEEAERVRQRRNEMTMRAMFSGGGEDGAG